MNNNSKNIRKRIKPLLLAVIFMTSIIWKSVDIINANANSMDKPISSTTVVSSDGKLSLDKTVRLANQNGEYEITLTARPNMIDVNAPRYVVFNVDISLFSKEVEQKILDTAKDICAENKNNKVAIVLFGGPASENNISGNAEDARTTGFNRYDDKAASLSLPDMTGVDKGTNIYAGLDRVNKIFKSDIPETVQKDVIMITDILPTSKNKTKYINDKNAEGIIRTTREIVSSTISKGINLYTIGNYSAVLEGDFDRAKELFNDIKGRGDESYFIPSLESHTAITNLIDKSWNDIKTINPPKIKAYASIENVESLYDTVNTKYFQIVGGSTKAYLGDSKNKVNESIKNGRITWTNIGSINNGTILNKNGITIKYTIKEKKSRDVQVVLTNNNDVSKASINYNGANHFFDNVSVKLGAYENRLTVVKSVENYNDESRTADIKFTISGDIAMKPPENADIVLVLDKSNSMGLGNDPEVSGVGKLAQLRVAANDFCDTILRASTNNNVKISVVSFGGDIVHGFEQPNPSSLAYENNFTSDLSLINKQICAPMPKDKDDNDNYSLGTDTANAIAKAGELLRNANPNSNKYIVLFTDGKPTGDVSVYDNLLSSTIRPDANYIPAMMSSASNVYKNVFYERYLLTNGNADIKREGIEEIKPIKNLKLYSIGYFSASGNKEYEAKKLMASIQNITDANEYMDRYFGDRNMQSIEQLFKGIASDISAQVSSLVAESVKITDTITSDFELQKNPDGSNKGATVKTENSTNMVPLDNSNVNSYGDNELEVKVDLGNIHNENTSVSIPIKVKNDYFGEGGVKTNNDENVSITYVDAISGETKVISPSNMENSSSGSSLTSPNVNIAYVYGSIQVEKFVYNQVEDKNSTEFIMDDTSRFPIYIEAQEDNAYGHKEKYVVDVNGVLSKDESGNITTVEGDSRALMEFTLRDNETRISNEKNYVTAGKYTVREAVPMDYKNVKIQWFYNGVWQDVVDDTVIIDSKNPNLKIRVYNAKINDGYWRHRDDIPNEMIYNENKN